MMAKTWVARHKIKLLVVDYLTLIAPDDRTKDRWVHVAEVCHALKELAHQCGIAILTPAQLNRAAEERKIPQLSDLRESGDIEQDADQVWLLSRRRREDGNLGDEASLLVAKHREGSTGVVRMRFIPDQVRFEET
jgi:replicative DNA helicase